MEKVLLSIISAAGLCAVLCHAERRYHFVYEEKNMAEARSYCREKYTDLATIDHMNDVKILNDMADLSRMNYSEFSYRAWIGLYDDMNSWRWSLTNTSFYKPGETEFRNWKPGRPNNYGSRQHCVVMDINGLWNDHWCDFHQQPVCSDVTGSNVTFVLAPTTMSWSDAVIYCREHHTDLASVRNMEENQKIKELASGLFVWIGLSRESWKWVDGSRSTFRYWGVTQPNNQFGKETCVAADFGNSGKWEDCQCHYKRAFICYSVPVSKQVIKVRLVKQSSSLDLNDPAVLEDMLKELRQNLRDQGVTQDVRLSWRKQADGKVFHKEKKKEKKKRNKIRMTRKTDL
ncbi:macrophage mannose receptor 1-like [Cheilinus undulatus]|uniref:macrophage mannose receptor 1-like n=1 Tax=Cheilinus undulatus TaxID=241271 RepID=UPI001BD677EB|nr:macrophage mannose receptor 1-like [Cheilinus undulatus]